MISIQFTSPQEFADAINQCISYGIALTHPDIKTDEHSLQTIFAVPVKPHEARQNTPPAPHVPTTPIPPTSTVNNRERIAAENHWSFLIARCEYTRSKLSEESANAFTKEWLKFAEQWYSSLEPKEKYALMRGPDVWLFAQCDEAWKKLSDYEKSCLARHGTRYKITKCKEEFLPSDIH